MTGFGCVAIIHVSSTSALHDAFSCFFFFLCHSLNNLFYSQQVFDSVMQIGSSGSAEGTKKKYPGCARVQSSRIFEEVCVFLLILLGSC